jgi:hypothetical protein
VAVRMTAAGYWMTNVGVGLLGIAFATIFSRLIAVVWSVMSGPAFLILYLWWLITLLSVVSRDQGNHIVQWMAWREAFKRQSKKSESDARLLTWLLSILNALLVGFVCAVILGLAVGMAWPQLKLPAFFLILAWWLSVGIYVAFDDRKDAV